MGIQIKKKVSSEGLLFLIYLFLFLNFILPSNHHSSSYTVPISPHFTIPCPLPIHHSPMGKGFNGKSTKHLVRAVPCFSPPPALRMSIAFYHKEWTPICQFMHQGQMLVLLPGFSQIVSKFHHCLSYIVGLVWSLVCSTTICLEIMSFYKIDLGESVDFFMILTCLAHIFPHPS